MSDEIIDDERFRRLGEQHTVEAFQGFKVGDLVSCYGCEKGNTYMPGVGVIVVIQPDEEHPFVCEHNDKRYAYKAIEISIHDFY